MFMHSPSGYVCETEVTASSYDFVANAFLFCFRNQLSCWHFSIFFIFPLLEGNIMYCRHTGTSSNEFE